jgi:hypothetical protein
MATTQASFERFGDKNCITPELSRAYIRPDGTPLDVQAEMLEETYPIGIDSDDLVTFMYQYPSGPHSYQSPIELRQQEINTELYDKLGFRINQRIASEFYTEFFTPKYQENNDPF